MRGHMVAVMHLVVIFAVMALPRDRGYDLDKESGVLTVDNGATTTLTQSLFNVSNAERLVVKIHLAGKGMHINSIRVGLKTHYVRVVTGAIQPITTKAFYVPGFNQDLLGGRALIKAKYRMVLDEDPTISGIFPVTEGQIDPATGFPFAESEGRFYVQTVPITESKYKSMSGYPLWHVRLSHCSFQTIKDTILTLWAYKNRAGGLLPWPPIHRAQGKDLGGPPVRLSGEWRGVRRQSHAAPAPNISRILDLRPEEGHQNASDALPSFLKVHFMFNPGSASQTPRRCFKTQH